MHLLTSLRYRLIYGRVGQLIREAVLAHPVYLGKVENRESRVTVGEGAQYTNAIFNVASGTITLEPWSMVAYEACLLAGSHDFTQRDRERQEAEPRSGYDIVIERGAFVGSRAVVIGPCRIGAHAVVGAGSVVTRDVEPGTIVAGAPAREVGRIDRPGAGARLSEPQYAG